MSQPPSYSSEAALAAATPAGPIAPPDILHQIFEAAAAGIVVTDAVGQILFVNPAWCVMTGYDAATLLAKNIIDITDAAFQDATMAAVARVRDTGEAVVLDKKYLRRDGSILFATSSVSSRRDAAGRFEGCVAIVIDVGAKYWQERRLQLLDAMSEATRQAADPAAIMAVTARLLGEHLHVSRCAYADVEADNNRFTIRSDWTAQGVASTAGVYTLDMFGAGASGDMRGGRTLVIRDVDRELAQSDGADMFNSIGVKAIICCPLVKRERLVAMMAVHHALPRDWDEADIALVREVVERCWAHIERVRAAALLVEADRRKTEFLATLAHELRNPLAPISTGLQFMRMSGADHSRFEHVRELMARQVGHMVRLIDDLLDMSRVSRGLVGLQKAPVALADIVAMAVEISQPLIDAQGHSLRVQLPPEPLILEADVTRMAQVLSNLLNNASKYTPQAGAITLRATEDGDHVRLSVSDNGIGIVEESLETIFEIFSRLGDVASRGQNGLGIGLSLVRHLTQLHGGTATAYSDGPGRGSTFVVRLPRGCIPASDGAGAPVQADTPLATTPSDRTKNVLIIDDNVDAAETLALVMRLEGYTVLVAHNGPDGIAQACQHRPEVIVLDLGMPGMDGLAVARRLRVLPETAGCLLLALTGWGNANDLANTRAAGFDHHLVKPATYAAIAALIEKAELPRSA